MSNMKAFTLIELMIVIAISVVVIGAGIAAYRGFADKYQIKQAGAEFQANLKLLQKKAISGEKPLECVGAFEGIRVRNIDANNYAFQAQCSTVDGDEQTVALPATVGFDASDFDLLFATLNAAVAGAPQTILLTTTGSTYNYEVKVEASGVIKGGLQ